MSINSAIVCSIFNYLEKLVMRFDGFRSIVESMRIVHQYKPTRNGNRHDPMNLLNTQMNDDYFSNQELPRHVAGRNVSTLRILRNEA